MTENLEDYSEDSILYELLEYFIKKQEPELISKNDTVALPTPGTIKNALRYLNSRSSLPKSISQIIGLTLPWKFAVGDSGRLLAILLENVIEIRKAKDEYSSVIGKASAPKDAFPQWRKLSWSPDASILVLASSNGHISFYNSLGNNMFNIAPTTSQSNKVLEAGEAVASLLFVEPSKNSNVWPYELIVITYSGLLKSYYVSNSNGYEFHYEFSFGNFYKNGINDFVYSKRHNLFYVAGNVITQRLNPAPSVEDGLTSWRRLNDYPHFKLSFTFEGDSKVTSTFSIWNWLPTLHHPPESIIFKMKISPSEDHLICLHTDGSISLWDLPNLRLQHKWSLSKQPDFDIPNPLSQAIKLNKLPAGFTEAHALDVGWWSDKSVIIARYSGSVSVCSIKDLKNLLGLSPEFFAGQPQICEVVANKGFMCLDCDTFVTTKKRSRNRNSEQMSEASSDSEADDDESEPVTIVNYTTDLLQGALYSITDIERFQPKRRKSKILHRTYRILGLKSTTPEELYGRKIAIQEYEEALALAKTYNLDTDLVYQTQWRNSEFTVKAINEHLSKVTKREWVLEECATRVPQSLEAARELLNFGLKGANLQTLLSMKANDDGKLVLDDIMDYNPNDSDSALKMIQKTNHALESLNLNQLKPEQKELIKCRRKLLEHLDKLRTYEMILESPEQYDSHFYQQLRQLTVVENAVRFAKDFNYQGVDTMFTYHGEKLMRHWLAIISFFPETLSPLKYERLLPGCDADGNLLLLDHRELRIKDWSEREEFNKILDFDLDDGSQFIYEAEPALRAFRQAQLTPSILSDWYKSRACRIESDCGLINNALGLLRIGQSREIKNLENLLLDLETLDDLVYQVRLDSLSLVSLQKLNNLQRINLMMSKTDEHNFVRDIKRRVIKFINRRKKYLGENLQESLLREYLISISKKDLQLAMKFFDHLRDFEDEEILDIVEDVTSLAVECLYSCGETEISGNAKTILETARKYLEERESSTVLPEDLDEIERELDALKILSKHETSVTLKYLRDNKNDKETAEMLLREISNSPLTNEYPYSEILWTELLNDLLEVHGLVFSCVDVEICFEICVEARLKSSTKATIDNSATLIETSKKNPSLLKVPYEKAVELVLNASREYYDTSKNLIDSNMELAKACLNLITDDNKRIKEEYDLINSLGILHEFNVDILPLRVRSTQDKLKLVEDCLSSRDDGYKKKEKLQTLADYLQIDKKNPNARNGKVLELVAKKAFEMNDYKFCASVCQQLLDLNYISAWRKLLDLGNCTDFEDYEFRLKCLWFSLNNAPNDLLEDILTQIHLVKIQILNSKMSSLIPTHEEEENEDEFTDEIPALQREHKEFVPKVLGTSTEFLKSSADLVKRSTFGLISSVRATKFWPIANSKNNEDTQESFNVNPDAQGFPCFYESLHDKCRISPFDTRYSKYSMPENFNKRLQLCQSLIRIATLSETTCYGSEVSDIDHLILECAEQTLTEDSLLGFAYLLSLRPENVPSAHSIFLKLPKKRIYIEMAVYYFCLQIYKRLHPDNFEIFQVPIAKVITDVLNNEEVDKSDQVFTTLQYWKNLMFEVPKETDQTDEMGKADNEPRELDANENTLPNNPTEEISGEVEVGDGWRDDWSDFSDGEVNSKVEESLLEKANYEQFSKDFDKISSREDYEALKDQLLKWPGFTSTNFTSTDTHPALQLLKIVHKYFTSETEIVNEFEGLIEKVENKEIIADFLFNNKEEFTFAEDTFMRLCSYDKTLENEALKTIELEYQKTEVPLYILAKLLSRKMKLPQEEINKTIKKVIKNALDNGNVPFAFYLLEQLEHIPSSLATFETSLHLLMNE